MFIGGPSRVRDSSKAGIDKWRFTIRKEWNIKPFLGLIVMVILFLLAINRVTNDADAQAAREILGLVNSIISFLPCAEMPRFMG